ncbi:MAG TPA: hypothetical protein VG892_04715, partial [Terriglobales bacterium]|nr:hypothetical protein [Terriglobales bacterium]
MMFKCFPAAVLVSIVFLAAVAQPQTVQLPPGVVPPQTARPVASQGRLPEMQSLTTDADEVSLSAETINKSLHDEPGLLLQVKRMLAKKASEQGRVLYVSELTDEAVFKLIE